MYSQENIQLLFDRIGWRNPINEKYSQILNDENHKSESGRFFQNWSQLVTIKNIYKTLDQKLLNNSYINLYLKQLNESVVLEVLSAVLNHRSNACKAKDLDKCIPEMAYIFDDAIGYRMAIKVSEIILATHRKNPEERRAKESYDILMLDLYGVKTDDGIILSKGLIQKYDMSIANISDCLIEPSSICINNVDFW